MVTNMATIEVAELNIPETRVIEDDKNKSTSEKKMAPLAGTTNQNRMIWTCERASINIYWLPRS